jgi:hypothetical protein
VSPRPWWWVLVRPGAALLMLLAALLLVRFFGVPLDDVWPVVRGAYELLLPAAGELPAPPVPLGGPEGGLVPDSAPGPPR